MSYSLLNLFLELTIVRCNCTISSFNQKSMAWSASPLDFRYVHCPLWPVSPIVMRVEVLPCFLIYHLVKLVITLVSCNTYWVYSTPTHTRHLTFYRPHNPIKVQLHIVGAIAELAKDPRAPLEMLRCKGCRTLVDILNIPNEELTSAAARAIAACAVEVGCRS